MELREFTSEVLTIFVVEEIVVNREGTCGRVNPVGCKESRRDS